MASTPQNPSKESPITTDEVVRRVEAWLSDDANVRSLEDAYAHGDQMTKELTSRSSQVVDEPLRVFLGTDRSNAH